MRRLLALGLVVFALMSCESSVGTRLVVEIGNVNISVNSEEPQSLASIVLPLTLTMEEGAVEGRVEFGGITLYQDEETEEQALSYITCEFDATTVATSETKVDPWFDMAPGDVLTPVVTNCGATNYSLSSFCDMDLLMVVEIEKKAADQEEPDVYNDHKNVTIVCE